VGVPSALPTISRRRLLVTALPAGVVLTALGTAGACAPAPPPPELTDLVAQFDRAHADSRLAGLAATTARPRIVPALTTVASVRAAHARALSDEITRLTGGQTPTTSASTATTTSSAPAAAPTVADVTAALHASADSAARLAATLSGYRAGLLGSIAAACTASYQVALADPGQAR
jgi:hypothetical protein